MFLFLSLLCLMLTVSQAGALPIVKALLVFGAELNQANSHGRTPFDIAAAGTSHVHQECAELLALYGAVPADCGQFSFLYFTRIWAKLLFSSELHEANRNRRFEKQLCLSVHVLYCSPQKGSF